MKTESSVVTRNGTPAGYPQGNLPAVLLLFGLFVVGAWLGLGCFSSSDSGNDTIVVVTTNIIDGEPVIVTNVVPADSVDAPEAAEQPDEPAEAAEEPAAGPQVLYTTKTRILEGRDFSTPTYGAPGAGVITAVVDWEEAGTMSAWLREGDTLRRRQWHGEAPIVLSHPTDAGADWNVHISAGVTTTFSVKIAFAPE